MSLSLSRFDDCLPSFVVDEVVVTQLEIGGCLGQIDVDAAVGRMTEHTSPTSQYLQIHKNAK